MLQTGQKKAVRDVTDARIVVEVSLSDAKWFMFSSSTSNIFESQSKLVDYMYFAFDVNNFKNEYNFPICFIQGSHDWITPTDLVKDYYKKLNSFLKAYKFGMSYDKNFCYRYLMYIV